MGTASERAEGSGDERRAALRGPVRGEIVLHANVGPLYGTLENLSRSGALLAIASVPRERELDIELRLRGASGWASARAVRVERAANVVRLAVAFARLDPALREPIEDGVADALAGRRHRPVLVVDDHSARRGELCTRLAGRGMTPLAPRTPRAAIDLLTRAQLHVDVCLLAPGQAIRQSELAKLLAESFPWVTTSEITDDVERTVERVVRAWPAPESLG